MKEQLILLCIFFSLSLPLQGSTPEQTAQELFTILESGRDRDYIGEEISQLDHALQCAFAAKNNGADNDTIIAALFHDIGHLTAEPGASQMDGYGVGGHEHVGAIFLEKRGFSKKVCELIKGHVEAKRYLTYKDPSYYNKLTLASQETLKKQGGPMTPEEAKVFEQDPYFLEKLLMRTWDEKAKVVGLDIPSLNTFRPLVVRHLKRDSKTYVTKTCFKRR